MSGAQVFGEEGTSRPALLLLGAAHLNEDHPQYLTDRQVVFVLATQLEHIKAGHLVLTSSEFWGAFRAKALSGGMALLSFIPVGSALGQLADGFAKPILEQLKKGADNALFRKLVRAAERQITEGAAHNKLQSAYEAGLDALLVSERRAQMNQRDEASMVKEELADFARAALYTADRFGLLAVDALGEAVHAMILLSSHHGELPRVKREGLAAFLAEVDPEQGTLRHEELAMRCAELFDFALSPERFEAREALFGPLN